MPARTTRHRTVALAAVAVAAVAVLAPASASASTVYAGVGGVQSGTCSTPATACGLYRAVETVAASGDTVVLGSGKYSIASTLTINKSPLTVVGAPGARPLIEFAASLENASGVETQAAANLTMSHLAIHAKGKGVQTLHTSGGTFSDLDMQAPAEGSTAFFTAQNATITNSTFVAGEAGDGIWNNGLKTDVRNVSVWSGGDGIYSSSGGGFKPVTRVHNSIVHGEQADFNLQSDNSQATLVTIKADHSAYRPTAITRSNTWTTFSDDGGNVAAAPLLADAPGGDFHQLAGSPTIDRGSHEAADGSTDIDGAARTQGPATDIGADEFNFVAPVSAAATPAAPAPAKASATPDPAPALGSLKLSPSSFRVVTSQTSKAKKKKAGGTSVSYRNSESASTRFTVQRRTVVRRHGKRKIVWTTQRGSFTHADHAGANRVRFSGKLAGHSLTAGSYRLVAVSRDAQGQKSAVRRAAFTVKG